MSTLPTGTVTFLFTDIEGSTGLWEQSPEAMKTALARHQQLLQQAIESNGGYVFQIIGDACCAAFHTAADALGAALAAQRALQAEKWDAIGTLRVRMGIHTGVAECRVDDVKAGQYVSNLTLARAQRIMAAAHGGQILLSHATEELVHDQVPNGTSLRDLGVHHLKGLVRPERLFQLIAPQLPSSFPPLRGLDTPANNLPVAITSFVGRAEEMEEIRRRLSVARLLTLTGAGGAGKSRLSLEVASSFLDSAPDGVWLVELAPLSDATLVPQAVASVIGVSAEQGRPLMSTLRDHLQTKTLLLILDNCEHLVTACAEVATDLLHACPSLRILATSREALNVAGETMFRVPSLAVPEPNEPLSVERLVECEAVRLLFERAVAVNPTFRVTERNARAVAQVCQHLDGIPLAIELAAARLKVFTVEQIVARLDDRFRLLTGGGRTTAPRHQTLRALIDWSHGLLSQSERVLLRRLSVFAGGWTFEAAEAVGVGDGIDRGEVLDVLTQLVSKSLVVADEQDGESRYRMLETIRQYACEQLQEAGEATTASERQLRYFVGLAKEAEPQLLRADQLRWLDRLDRELANIRTALAWSLANDRTDAGIRLAAELWRFWQMRGLIGEGREWLQKLLLKQDASDAARAQALYQAGFLASMDADRVQAISFATESAALCRRLGDGWGTALSLVILGAMTGPTSREQAEALLHEGVTLFREIGDQWRLGQALMYVAQLREHHRDFEGAVAARQENLALFRMLGDRRGLGFSLMALARAAMSRGDPEQASRFATESLTHFETVGDKQGMAGTLLVVGKLKIDQRDFGGAKQCLTRGLTLYHKAGSRTRVAFALEEVANLAMVQGQWRRAAILYGAAAPLLESVKPSPYSLLVDRDRMVAVLRSRLDPAIFDAACAEGRAMTIEQAIDVASSADGG